MKDERHAAFRRGRGFTLVELLVAMLVAAIVTTVIFALFDSTSSALYEADSLADSVDTARFGLERVRSDIKQAGAFGTPDSAFDPRVRPKSNTLSRMQPFRVAGLVSYDGWQDYAQTVMPNDVWDQAEFEDNNGNLLPNFDGIVVIGAYDYPFMFEVGNLSQKFLTVYDHPRGLDKLQKRNVLDLADPEDAFDGSNPTDVIDQPGRVLRLRDQHGNYQFLGIESFGQDGSNLRIEFTNSIERKCEQRDAGGDCKLPGDGDVGFPPATDDDAKNLYYASLLDVYWYHVIQDPADEHNFQLVRHRLTDGWNVVRALDNWEDFDPSAHTASDYTVVANRVVDFQIWFDCATDQEGAIENAAWNADWRPPDGTGGPDHGCMNPPSGSSGSIQPETANARVAHVRLSIRTEDEREELRKEAFPDAGPLGNHTTLETFDIHPDNPGKTRVYTVQSDFELMNYAVRNITAGLTN